MSWKSKPSCYILADKDRTVQPDLQRLVAERMGDNVFEAESSNVPMRSETDLVLDGRTYSAIVDALTATVINSQAGLNWLSAQRPDLEEVRRVLDTIAKDGKRAGEIVVRLRARMKRSPQRTTLLMLELTPPRWPEQRGLFGPDSHLRRCQFSPRCSGQSSIKRALIRGVPIYEYSP